jgi:hypothetical protein
MKTEMAMLSNGNYERIISPIQHKCEENGWICIEYGWKKGIHLEIESGDPYEDGCSHTILVKYCPFCGYHSS